MAIPFHDESNDGDEVDGIGHHSAEVIDLHAVPTESAGTNLGGEPANQQLPPFMAEAPIGHWDVGGPDGDEIVISLSHSFAAAMAAVVQHHYNAAVALGHPFTTAIVQVSPMQGHEEN